MTRFVAERPHHHTGIVAEELHLARIALDDGVLPFLEPPNPFVAVARLVGLNVGFGDYINAVAVAKLVPEIMVRIMAGAAGIDVILFKERDILEHIPERNRTPVVRVGFMAVDPLELNGHTVDIDRIADDALILQTDALHADIISLPDDQSVEIWFFRRPEIDVGGIQRLSARRGRKPRDLLFGRVVKLRAPLAVDARNRNRRLRAYAVLNLQIGFHREIPDAALRPGPDGDIAENSGETEHVLIFQIAAVAPAEHLNRNLVGTVLKEPGDIELAGEFRVLRITGHLAVDPDVIRAVHAVETENDLAPLPVFGNGETAAVAGNGIEIPASGLAVENLRPLVLVGIANVGVPGDSISAHFHAARHVDRGPVGIVEIRPEEIERPAGGIAHPVDFPIAVQRKFVGGRRLQFIAQRRLLAFQRHRISARRQAVARIDRRVLPVVYVGGESRKRGRAGREKHCRSHHHVSFRHSVEI